MAHEETLAKTSLFADFSPEHIRKLAAVVDEESIPAQSELFREGDGGSDLYVLALGTVKVLKKGKDGDEEEVATLGSGSYFGEMGLVLQDHTRTGTIRAMEDSKVLKVTQEALAKLCEDDPSFGREFYRAVARGLARRLNMTNRDVAQYRAYWREHRHG